MQTNRIEYIDKLKGIAIICVVMGHLSEKSMLIKDIPFNHFYGSFQMPLFMFLSGIFAFKTFSKCSFEEFLNFFKKKVLRILIPFLTIGGGNAVLRMYNEDIGIKDAISGYWFLPALFYCMVVGVFANALRMKLGKSRLWIDVVIELAVCGLLMLGYVSHIADSVPFYLNFVKMYPFFIMGALFRKYDSFSTAVKSDNWVYSLSIVLYIILWFVEFPIKIKTIGFFSIVIWVQLFIRYDAQIPQWLKKVGRYSLEIYVFHWFFIPSIPAVGQWLLHSNGTLNSSQNSVLVVVISAVIASVIIALCILTTKVIRQSTLFSLILFGSAPKVKIRE